jgi:creatinine amidohydrolase
MKNSKVLYEELTPEEFRARIKEAPIAYLPLGTIEWHGEHLPLGADGLQSRGFFERLARESGGIVLPMLFLGPDRMQKTGDRELYGMDISHTEHKYRSRQLPGSAYWVPDETFKAILDSVLKQLKRAGFGIVVAHGHGPSTEYFRDHSAEWCKRFGLVCFDCWGSEYDEKGLGIQVDHAAMNETSLVMALRPELVQMDRLPQDPAHWPLAVEGRDPRAHASAEVGAMAIALQVDRMSKILAHALKDLTPKKRQGKR